MTKKVLSTLVLGLLCCLSAVAQNLKVESFRALTKDMTARIDAPLKDQNGDWCAIIKVTSNVLNDLEFQAPALGIMKIDKHTGEKWVYVPAGSKSISLFHSYCGTLRDYRYPVKIEKQCVYEMRVKGDTDGGQKLAISNIVIKVDGNAEIFINGTSRGNGTWAGTLTEGDYEVECHLENCAPTRRHIHVTAGRDESFNMDRPVPFIGQLRVTSTPSSARIIVDGRDMGVITPYTFENITAGSHKINLSLDNYLTGTHEVSIKKDETSDLDVVLDSKVTINSKPEDATLKINGEEVSHTPYTTYLAPGEHTITLEKSKYKTVTKSVLVGNKPIVEYYTMHRQYFNSSNKNKSINRPPYNLYADIDASFGSFSDSGISYGGAIGGFIKNFNAEVYCKFALNHGSTQAEWVDENKTSQSGWFRPQYIVGTKLGCCFPLGTRICITPRIGVGRLSVKEIEGSNCSALTGSVDARLDIALIKHFALTIVPEYSFAINKSKTYKYISEKNEEIKDWANGFNLRFGLCFNLNL